MTKALPSRTKPKPGKEAVTLHPAVSTGEGACAACNMDCCFSLFSRHHLMDQFTPSGFYPKAGPLLAARLCLLPRAADESCLLRFCIHSSLILRRGMSPGSPPLPPNSVLFSLQIYCIMKIKRELSQSGY